MTDWIAGRGGVVFTVAVLVIFGWGVFVLVVG